MRKALSTCRTLPHGAATFRVTADGEGVVSPAGAVRLRVLADRSGLTDSLSRAFARRDFMPVMTMAG
jgi:hypothetical protein